MTFLRRVAVALAAAVALTLSLSTAPAQAVTAGSFKICQSSLSYGSWLRVYDTDSAYEALIGRGACTSWLWPAGIRVHINESPSVASFKAMITTGPTWASRPCHENDSDYDPPNPNADETYEVWIRTYNHSNCTN